MGGLVALLGPRSDERAIRAMAAAAPHRGLIRAVRSGSWGVVGAQWAAHEPAFTRGGVAERNGTVAVICGCLYAGARTLDGDDAAERLLATFLELDERGASRLRGSFAGVITGAGRTVAIRSAGGERPLFWRRTADSLIFASEVKQILAAPAPSPPVDLDYILATVADDLPAVTDERTAFAGVRRVPAGACARLGDAADTVRVFWNPPIGERAVSFDEASEMFRSAFADAVARRWTPGTGLLLSGGMDSSAIAVVAGDLAQRDGARLRVVSGHYPALPDVDEEVYVRATASELGLDLTFVRPNPSFFADLDGESWLHDGFAPPPLAGNFIAFLEAARAGGLSTVMDGHDGDGVLGTQPGVGAMLLRAGRMPTFLQNLREARRASGLPLRRSARTLLLPALIDAIPGGRRSVRRVRPAGGATAPVWVTGSLRERARAARPDRSWLESRALHVMRVSPMALEGLERVASGEGVGLLHPFSDPDLIDLLLSFPPHVLFHGGRIKALSRDAVGDRLPASITARRRKTVFDPLALAGADIGSVRKAVAAGPQALPGIDWNALDARLDAGSLDIREVLWLRRVLAADRAVGAA